MTKDELRKIIKSQTKEQQPHFDDYSRKLCQLVLESPEYKAAKSILAYKALPDEVNIDEVLTHAKENEKAIYLPRIIPGTTLMEFFEGSDERALEIGSFGIFEPLPDSKKLSLPDLIFPALVIVPGRAFTSAGDRLGRGKGFYDRFLSEAKKMMTAGTTVITLAGICFPFQLLESIPTDQNDIRMDKVFSLS